MHPVLQGGIGISTPIQVVAVGAGDLRWLQVVRPKEAQEKFQGHLGKKKG
jgi:hypothetical protein